MDDNKESVQKFEEIFKQHNSKRTSKLYSTNKSNNITSVYSKIDYQPKDIIRNISAQIKAIQNADSVVKSKSVKTVLDKHKTSSFLPVNMLQTFEVPSKKSAKFETQFVLDTQLMNVIEDVEAMSSHKGITQEFETSFDNNDENDRLKLPVNSIRNSLNSEVDQNTQEAVHLHENCERNSNNNAKISQSIFVIEESMDEKFTKEYESSDDKILLDDNCTDLLNQCMEVEENMKINNIISDVDISPSPIININNGNKSKNTSPLVYNLESFEKFEKLAVPFVEENNDINTVKHLINSQILDNELFLQTDFEPEFRISEERHSPVLKISKTPQLNVERKDETKLYPENKIETISDELKDNEKESTSSPTLDFISNVKKKIVNFQKMDSANLEDEILFSSDEELDIKEAELKDLPFTCALETSFYEHSDVLDTTMYVGFQTASNKSIKVSAVSFTKAKSILDDETDLSKGLSLKDLVDKCDKNPNFMNNDNYFLDKCNEEDHITKSKKMDLGFDIITTSEKEMGNIDILDENMDRSKSLSNHTVKNEPVKDLLKCKFDGFKTASNKDIILSEKALTRCKRVFQDIDLENNFSDEELTEIEPCSKKLKLTLENNENTKIKAYEKEVCDTEFPKIDEDILQEFEGEMSFDNKVIDKQECNLDGFKTDSNKNYKIPASAVNSTSKKILDDIDFQDISTKKYFTDSTFSCKEESKSHEKSTVGFKTASNKIISISDKALAKTKHVFEDIDIPNFETAVEKTNTKNDNNDINIDSFVGFKTASNKKITVSKDAIAKTKNIFQDIDKPNPLLNNENVGTDVIEKDAVIRDIKPSTYKESFVVGFKTANNNKITITEAALEKTTNIFKDIDDMLPEKNYSKNKQCNTKQIMLDENITEKFNKHSKATLNTNVSDIVDSAELDPVFKGFQTANNKEIKISAQALAKSRKIFEELNIVDVEPDIVKETNLKPVFKGFQTANNKEIKISALALAKSRKILNDLNVDDKETEKVQPTDTEPIFKGFCTASNKEVKISAQALAKSRKIFDELNKVDMSSIVKETCIKPVFKGFQTASNKEVKISADAKSRMIFDDLNKDVEETEKVQPIKTEPVFKGFQTANNKEIKISAQALAKSRHIFDELNKFDDESYIVNETTMEPVFKGFHTARNKEVKISALALAKSRKLFDDLDVVDKEMDKVQLTNAGPVFKGFQTASNKEVRVSVEALAKGRKLFEDSENNVNKIEIRNLDLQSDNQISKKSCVGFQTASNKNVQISAKALEKSRKLFKDLDVVKEDEIKFEKNNTMPFSGFQTANNKEVKVSSEALAKSKKLFEESPSDHDATNNKTVLDENIKDNKTPSGFRGFQTAAPANNKVKISAEALAKSRKIFEDLSGFKENNCDQKNIEQTKNFDCFKTANNKNVVFSEESIQILSDINTNESRNINPAFSFKTANNKNIKISEESLMQSKTLFTEFNVNRDKTSNSDVINKVKTDNSNIKDAKLDYNLERLIDTQVINNFDESLNTEDFRSPENRSKRSGSPILSCPKAKKRKFATPYRKDTTQHKPEIIAEKIEIYDDNYKKNKLYTLKDLIKLENNNTETKTTIDLDLNNIDLDNFEFKGERNDINNSKMSAEDLKHHFLKAVNKKLVPDGWFENHLKMVLWKLISYEIKFPKTMSGVCSAKNVLAQMKYRYFKELYNAERPALRKIMEKDDVASKTLVLCVMDVINDRDEKSGANTTELLLTDGWYSIRASIDKMLTKYVNDGKIRIGAKIATHGAELVNCEQGVAPWEDTSSVRLKIFGNSTRRARWDARLGYHGNGAILSHLSAVKPEGGKVAELRVIVTRAYPALYVEKFEDGSTVTRSERLEHIHQAKYEAERQAIVEKIYEEVEKEMSDEDSPDTEDLDMKRSLDSGSQIARMLKKSKEPSQFRATLTESQRRLLEDHTAFKRDRILQDIQDRIRARMSATRNVVPLLKIRVATVEGKKAHKALLSIWKPNDALSEILVEGATVDIFNVVPTAIRYSELQLSAGRQTIFKPTDKRIQEKMQPYIKSLSRTCYPIKEIVTHPNMITDYNEIDTVGLVIQIDPSHKDFKSVHQFQNVYLTDEEKNIICLNFWGGIKKFGFQNVLDTGQVVACVNLQKRVGNTRKHIPHYRATEFTYFTKTPKNVNAKILIDDLQKKVLKNKGFLEECLVVKNRLLKNNISYDVSPYRFQNHDLSKNKIYIESPLARREKQMDEFNLSGLDFDSTFRQTEQQELSPKSLLRKKRINERISKLKMYGEPPPLSPINIINRSKDATKSYKSPLLNTSVANKTPFVSVKILPENRENELSCSPVLSVHRTLKKGVPVKLNFENVAIDENDGVDHFAEEFDPSPPLSLD